MKTHLISIVILVLLILLVIGIHKSFYVFMTLILGAALSVLYFCIYLLVSRNITNKDENP